MTKEDAKKILYSIAEDLGFTGVEDYTCKDGEKMRDAIKILEQEPCEDCISRQAALNESYAYGYGLEPEGYCVDVEDILALPPVTPARKKGEWIKRNNDYFDWYECSECGYGSDGEMRYNRLCDVRTKFCPDCGSQNLKGE